HGLFVPNEARYQAAPHPVAISQSLARSPLCRGFAARDEHKKFVSSVVAGPYRVGGSDGAPYENPVKGEKTN
ncbi:MAG: hypothetical protein QMB69_01020, partial [Candidatus Nanopelagicales bacterium]